MNKKEDNQIPLEEYEKITHAEIFSRLNKMDNNHARLQGAIGFGGFLMLICGAFILNYISQIGEVSESVIQTKEMIRHVLEDRAKERQERMSYMIKLDETRERDRQSYKELLTKVVELEVKIKGNR